MNNRSALLQSAAQTVFDVAIIGGGITGAALYHRLCSSGYKVLLLDKGDFACGSSQSSGMMIWGGVLYLRRLDIASVLRFSRARDGLLRDFPGLAAPASFRYLPPPAGRLWRYAVLSTLYAYWLLGRVNRRRPLVERSYEEQALLDSERRSPALRYEEGLLRDSDSRFVLQWITPYQSYNQVPLNYCSIDSGRFNRSRRCWRLTLTDQLSGAGFRAEARCAVNCAGVWADTINQRFGIVTPFRHVLSKGVYIAVPRAVRHSKPLAFEMGAHGDVLTYVPWGPVSLWGPTESLVSSVEEGYSIDRGDVRFLLEHAARHLQRPISIEDVVSVRCGVRPLAVKQHYRKQRYPLTLSRNHHIVTDRALPWVSFYGGKLTNCLDVAQSMQRRVAGLIGLPKPVHGSLAAIPGAERKTEFPGVRQRLPAPAWCRRYEFCHTLEDYLRRRTNIAQWVPREGLGRHNENLPQLQRIAMELYQDDSATAAAALSHYRRQVEQRFDELLAQAA